MKRISKSVFFFVPNPEPYSLPKDIGQDENGAHLSKFCPAQMEREVYSPHKIVEESQLNRRFMHPGGCSR